MTKNWSAIYQQPETVDDAVNRLLMILEGNYKLVLATMQEEELIDLRFSLGLAIQNAFGLHEPGSKLLASCNNAVYPNASYNFTHPGDASEVIISELWRALRT